MASVTYYLQFSCLKQHKLIILKSSRPNVWHGSHWDKEKCHQGCVPSGGSAFLPFPAPEAACLPLLVFPFSHLQSQSCRVECFSQCIHSSDLPPSSTWKDPWDYIGLSHIIQYKLSTSRSLITTTKSLWPHKITFHRFQGSRLGHARGHHSAYHREVPPCTCRTRPHSPHPNPGPATLLVYQLWLF